jgi:phosphoglycolate phosphatase
VKTRLPLPRLALVDLDGTLVDTLPDIAFCVDEMLARLGLPPRGPDAVRDWVGNGVEVLVSRALTGSLDGKPDEELYARALPMFMDLYAHHTSERSREYPGAREGLAFLEQAGVALACVTNKAARYTDKLLADLGLTECFSLIISGDSLPLKKPDPMPLVHAAEHFCVEPQEVLLVGDSVNDVRAARAAGFAVVCVSYGYNHGEDIRASRPDVIIDSLAELPTLFAGTTGAHEQALAHPSRVTK